MRSLKGLEHGQKRRRPWNEEPLAQQRFERGGILSIQQILRVQDAYHVGEVTAIDWKAREPGAEDGITDGSHGLIDVKRHDVRSGSHDICH